MSLTDVQRILDATNSGLDIILHYYPQAEQCVGNNKKFKIRGEKTPSSAIKCINDIYIVTDFGDDSKGRNAIDVCIKEEGISFPEAIKLLNGRYSIQTESKFNTAVLRAEYSTRAATEDETNGSWYFDTGDLTDLHLKEIFAKYVYQKSTKQGVEQSRSFDELRKLCLRYCLFALNSYTVIKEGKAHIFTSTPSYPMFIYDYKDWKKIYQPRNPDKSKRFLYHGNKPIDHINGLSQVKMAWDENFKVQESSGEEKESEKKKPSKFDELFIVSGDRDALNLAALGHQVVWLNSETASLSRGQHKNLEGLTKKIINVPDIDETGLRKAHELNLKYLEIHTLELPKELKKFKDFRGNSCKDIRDYLQHFNEWQLSELIKVALPYRFWKGFWNPKINKFEYEVNNTVLYHFLAKQGYHRLKSVEVKEGYLFIHVNGHIVRRIDPKEIRDYINNFLIQQRADIELRNAFYRTNQTNESSLSNLPYIEIDFTDFDKETQYLFFKNATWKVTASDIEIFKPGEIDKYVWENEVIQHEVSLLPPAFEIKSVDSVTRSKITNRDCLFLRLLENCSKVHWKVEEEGVLEFDSEFKPTGTRKEFTEAETLEHELHLANKLYALGYLLHKYKNPGRPWAVWAMDNEVVEESESHGGSGKSIVLLSLTHFMPADQEILYTNILNGRDPKLTENIHIFGDVTEHTDFVLVNDAHQYLNFQFFFEPITGTMSCNPKHSQRYTLPFSRSPKFGFTSNYAVRKADPSTERRLLYVVFSDYYHHGPNDKFEEERTPLQEFGKNLWDDFDETEWNLFFNTMARSLQLYLQFDDKISAPRENILRRTLKSAMGDEFKSWADVYFGPENEQANKLLVREDVKKEFQDQTGTKQLTTQRFSGQLKAWCSFYGYNFNPKELLTPGSSRLIRKHDGVAKEMIYVQTNSVIVKEDELDF